MDAFDAATIFEAEMLAENNWEKNNNKRRIRVNSAQNVELPISERGCSVLIYTEYIKR